MDFSDDPGPAEFFTRFPLDWNYVIGDDGDLRLMIEREGRPDAMLLAPVHPVMLDQMDDPAVALAIICGYLHGAPAAICKKVAEFFTGPETEFLLYVNRQFAAMSGQPSEIQ